MAYNPIQEALLFISNTFFDLYMMIVLFRFFLQLAKADYSNPLSQFIVKATNPLLRPLRKVIPGWGGIDLASIVLLIILQMLAFTVDMLIKGHIIMPSLNMLLGLCLLAVSQIIKLACNMLIGLIFINVVMSWLQPGGFYNPMLTLFSQITNPILYKIQKHLPAMGGLDFSPMVLLFLLMLVRILFVIPIAQFASAIML